MHVYIDFWSLFRILALWIPLLLLLIFTLADLYNSKNSGSVKLLWLIAILALPVAGASLYFTLSTQRADISREVESDGVLSLSGEIAELAVLRKNELISDEEFTRIVTSICEAH